MKVVGYQVAREADVLTDAALEFVEALERTFGERRRQLIAHRAERARAIAGGQPLDFLPETAAVRADAGWRVAPCPDDLQDRRVEITGPTDRKMAINALNSGARIWLADFEDANAPTWANLVGGQVTLQDAVAGTLTFDSDDGRHYAVTAERPAVIVARPRGWHLEERHLDLDGRPVSAALVDFGLYFFHNAAALLAKGSGPYFYLPKMESHLEARLWADVFAFSEERLGIQRGSVRATVLIETIWAAFEMDEILYELRDYASGLNAGRWDYLFSLIKTHRSSGPEYVLPDRNAVTMTAPCMRSYTDLLVKTCHARGAHAIGGMAAFIPNRRAEDVTRQALDKVRQDKEREAGDGFDGSWVAHPDLVEICQAAFDAVLGDRPNQIERQRDDVHVDAAAILDVAATAGGTTVAGLTNDVGVALRYLEAWLRGNGAAAIFNLMEDVATAEIARSQIWQWIHHGVTLDDGNVVTRERVVALIDAELAAIEAEVGAQAFAAGRWADARAVLERIALTDELVDFLTYEALPLID